MMSEASKPPIITPETEDFPPFYRFVFGTTKGETNSEVPSLKGVEPDVQGMVVGRTRVEVEMLSPLRWGGMSHATRVRSKPHHSIIWCGATIHRLDGYTTRSQEIIIHGEPKLHAGGRRRQQLTN